MVRTGSTSPLRRRRGDAAGGLLWHAGWALAIALAGGAMPERTLFWRFGSKDQKAARRGAYKYLSINGNEFLFDVVQDPLERGNLKDRMPDRFAELKAAFEAWDAGMLHDPDAPSFGITPTLQADHFDPVPGG